MSASPQLAYSTLPKERRRRGVFGKTAAWLGNILFWTVLAGVLVGGSAWAAGAYTTIFGVIAGIGVVLLLAVGATLARGTRRVRDLAVVAYLDQAVRLNIPMPAMLAAAVRSERGPVRGRLAKLQARLVAGDSVAVALKIAAPALPRRMAGLVMAGENTGRLARSIRRINTRREFFPAKNPVDSIFIRWYPMVLLVFIVGITELVLVYAMPRFSAALGSFRQPPPALARWQPFAFDYGPQLLGLCGLLLLILCGRMLSQFFTPAGLTLGPLRRSADALLWFMPIIGGEIRHQSLADACYVIAGASDAGLSLAEAVDEAANAAPNVIMQRRLKAWASRMHQGGAPGPAAKAACLPRLLRELAATVKTSADAKEVFDFLSLHFDAKHSRSAMAVRAAIIPACALGFGVIVGLIALGVFQPMVDLVKGIVGR